MIMLSLDEIIQNIEKEQEYIEYEYDLKDICNEYSEDDLILYETGNRMGGPGGIFFLRKDGKNKIIFVDEEDDLLYKHFPIVMNLESKYETNYENEKYNYIYTGFGGKLYIDKKIYNEYYKKVKELSDKYDMPYEYDTFDEHFIHSYWITVARDMFK